MNTEIFVVTEIGENKYFNRVFNFTGTIQECEDFARLKNFGGGVEILNKYSSGDSMSLFVNQGLREAVVLGTINNLMIVEYEMPSGSTALQIMENIEGIDFGKSVSYKSCSTKWIQAIRDGVGSWMGMCQRNGHIDFPEQ